MGHNEQWNIETERQRFEALKSQERFWQVLALARAVNALRFVQAALLGHEREDDSPWAQRTRMNSFFFNCALLYEGLLLVQRLCKHYGQFPQFMPLHQLLKDPLATALRNSSLAAVRNRLAFHFDESEIGRQLAKPDMVPGAFAAWHGNTNVNVYYVLADICAMRAFSDFSFDDTGLGELGNRLYTTTQLSVRYMEAAEEFIVAVLKSDGWAARSAPSTNKD